MSNFDINEEIDKIVDKSCLTLKSRIKTIVERSQKQLIRQYIASQKDTTKTAKAVKPPSKPKASTVPVVEKRVYKKENDYNCNSESDDVSDSD